MLSVQCTKVKRNCMVVHPSRPPLSSLTVIPDSSLFLTCRKSVESAPEKVHVSKVCRKCTRKGAQCHVMNYPGPGRNAERET